jgi:hypothetical protein
MKRQEEQNAAHDAWFRAKVQEALNDPRPAIPHKKMEASFAKRRASALRKAKKSRGPNPPRCSTLCSSVAPVLKVFLVLARAHSFSTAPL